jgi:hypothetical protein
VRGEKGCTIQGFVVEPERKRFLGETGIDGRIILR